MIGMDPGSKPVSATIFVSLSIGVKHCSHDQMDPGSKPASSTIFVVLNCLILTKCEGFFSFS